MKKIYLLLLSFIICIFSIASISAAENTVNEGMINTDNNQQNVETDIHYDDVSTSAENVELNSEDNDDKEGMSVTDETTTGNDEELSFTDLNRTINDNSDSVIYLSNNYKYDKDKDSIFQNGIKIRRNLTIYGIGPITVDGNNMARIFNVVDTGLNVNFYNINFINGHTSKDGGAILGGNAYNCSFINNDGKYGGAIYFGNAYDCYFTNNSAKFGGSIYYGDATNCMFTENNVTGCGGAIYGGDATNCSFTKNNAGMIGGAIFEGNATNCTFEYNSAKEKAGALYHGNVYNCVFTNNKAVYGGAFNRGNVYNCVFTNNEAEYGGAIEDCNATHSTFKNNKADYGGAIHYGDVRDCTFENNTAKKNGGAIDHGNTYNCTFTKNKANDNGGAIDHGNAYICNFTGNKADNGGAMFESNATDCLFVQNNANIYGGAIHYGNATNCTFQDNSAKENGGAINRVNAYNCNFTNNKANNNGGAIDHGNAINCNFTNNKADEGGAIYGGDATNCNFTNNKADVNGGAIYEGDAYNCNFDRNEAFETSSLDTGCGGAIYKGDATNCNFTNNKADEIGGAIFEGKAYNCNFSNNKADAGGAIFGGKAYNCNFSNNKASNSGGAMCGKKAEAYFCTFNYNTNYDVADGKVYFCIFNGKKATWSPPCPVYHGKYASCTFNGEKPKDSEKFFPKIKVSDLNSVYQSGEKLKFKLKLESEKLFSDDMTLNGLNTTIKIYQYGSLVKTVYGLTGEGWVVDLEPGKYTAELSLTDYPNLKSKVTITIKGGSTFKDLNITINGNNNDTVYLSDIYYMYYASDEAFKNGIVINRDLTIYGNGAIINGNKLARIFKVENNVNVKFYNITFKNGKADEGGAIYGGNAYNCNFDGNSATYGGAIYQGNVSFCNFNGNHATDGGAIYGGYAYNCNFDGNSATYGGAIYQGNAYNSTFTGNNLNYGGAKFGGAIYKGNVYYSTFTGNIAAFGGAIFKTNAYGCLFHGNIGENGGAVFGGNATNCTFTNNNQAMKGGAIYNGNVSNSIFDGNNAVYGGSMYYGDASNCIFANNKADENGGATYLSNVYNSNFTGNIAKYGGAMFMGNASLCNFNGDTNCNTTIIPLTINVVNYTSTYVSWERLKFTLKVKDKVVDGINTTIKIYKGSSLVKTVYGLTGEGWVVDLEPGTYTVVFSLTDYPDENSSNATITVKNKNTTVDISPIINAEVGKEIIVNYTSISNGTATITVNGQVIAGGKFTPTKPGIYNLTVDIAENEYYSSASNQITFVVEKINPIVVISPIIDVKVGKEIIVNYTSISNGTATITVNGQVIAGGKFTPTKPGTYNITVDIAENEYYTAARDQITFFVEKISPTVLINSIGDVVVGQVVDIDFITNSNSTATIKVNGQVITGGKFTPSKPGIYILTVDVAENDYYTAACDQITFVVDKINSTVLINSIGDVVVGQVVDIDFITNSNGTATISVNGQVVSGGKFTPSKPGIYNLTVDIAENDYYTEASSEITFFVEKISPTVLINSIGDVVVGQVVDIDFITNSNGTATISVNGQVVSGGKFTPSKPGIYNLTVDIAENDYYTAARDQITFAVIDKFATKIIANSLITTYNMGEYLVITLNDGEGKPITDAVLTVNLDGDNYYTTDDKGQIKINADTLVPKTYDVKITYNGSDIYNGSTESVNVTVKKATPKITAKSTSYKLKTKTKNYTVSFKNNKNQALKNSKVTLKVNGKTYTVKTNSNGQAVFKITNLNKKGTYSAVITFPANNYYNKVSKNVKINVIE